jgi:hypothetical protein
MTNFKYKAGYRGISILGVLLFCAMALLVLSYFHVSVKNIVESPTGQENISYVKGETTTFWDTYLKEPAHYLWYDVWINIFWKGFIHNMERIRDGKPTDFDNAANKLKVSQ